MRCIICKKGHYPYQTIFQTKKIIEYSICEKCFVKHPVFFEYESMPLDFHKLEIMHCIHDGFYPSYAYDFVIFHIIKRFNQEDQLVFLIYEEISEESLEYLTQIHTFNIFLFNYQTR